MLDIIYKCRDYAVIFKPCGMLSEGEMPAALREALEAEGEAPEAAHVVHRLDRGTDISIWTTDLSTDHSPMFTRD